MKLARLVMNFDWSDMMENESEENEEEENEDGWIIVNEMIWEIEAAK